MWVSYGSNIMHSYSMDLSAVIMFNASIEHNHMCYDKHTKLFLKNITILKNSKCIDFYVKHIEISFFCSEISGMVFNYEIAKIRYRSYHVKSI